jgi:hypothetical protein
VLRNTLLLVAVAFTAGLHVRAVEMNGSYDSVEPADVTVPGWDSGWGAPDVTGWDYVGSIGGTSGVYLGDGWVLTAAHVGAATFILDSGPGAGTYQPSGLTYSFTTQTNTGSDPADLTLFQIKNAPSSLVLPELSLATSEPSQFLYDSTGSNTVMIGFGDGGTTSPTDQSLFKTWGQATVDLDNQGIQVKAGSKTYVSADFITVDNTVSKGRGNTSTNDSQLVSGDSGGGDFIYNSSLGKWQLAGINEATGSAVLEYYQNQWQLVDTADAGATNVQDISLSAMVQISSYESQINEDMEAPEPPVWLLAGSGLAALFVFRACRRRALSL